MPEEIYYLRLFITGGTPRSLKAVAIVTSICEKLLPRRYDLEVIDIYQQPILAKREDILAAPTLVKRAPQPAQRIVGDLSDRGRLLRALNLAE